MKQIEENNGKNGISRREFILNASAAAAGLAIAPVSTIGAPSFTKRSAFSN